MKSQDHQRELYNLSRGGREGGRGHKRPRLLGRLGGRAGAGGCVVGTGCPAQEALDSCPCGHLPLAHMLTTPPPTGSRTRARARRHTPAGIKPMDAASEGDPHRHYGHFDAQGTYLGPEAGCTVRSVGRGGRGGAMGASV